VIAISCDWGGDLSVGASGDISTISIEMDVKQRIIRRLLTNSGDYIWHSHYGAGLGSYVGSPRSYGIIEDIILKQIQLERLVAVTPAPSVQIDKPSSGLLSNTSVLVQYQIVSTATESLVALDIRTS